MKKIVLIILLLISPAMADVDLITRATGYWKNAINFSSIPIESMIDTTGWTNQQFKAYFKELWKHNYKGDIVEVLPVAESHGTNCCYPPKYVVITVTGVSVEQARLYLGAVEDTLAAPDSDSTSIKHRKYHFKQAVVDSALSLWNNTGEKLALTKQKILNQNLIIGYDLATIKQKIIDRIRP